MTVFIMAGMVLVAPRVIARFGPKRALVTGMGVLAVGLGLLALVRPDGSYIVDVLPATLVAAAGMSLAFIPSLGIALSSARPEEGGLAAGIVNTSYQVGSALGLAAMTAVAAANGADQVGDVTSLTDGYSAVFLGAAVVAAVGAVIAAVTLRLPKPQPRGGRRGDGGGRCLTVRQLRHHLSWPGPAHRSGPGQWHATCGSLSGRCPRPASWTPQRQARDRAPADVESSQKEPAMTTTTFVSITCQECGLTSTVPVDALLVSVAVDDHQTGTGFPDTEVDAANAADTAGTVAWTCDSCADLVTASSTGGPCSPW